MDIKRQAEAWHEAGWKGYDPNAQPLTDDEIPRQHSAIYPVEENVSTRREETAVGSTYPRDRAEAARNMMDKAEVGVKELQSVRPWTDYESDFRRDFERRWKNTSATWEQYEPVYRYAYDVASDPHYRDRDWDDIEVELRKDWEDRNDSAWDKIKDAVRAAWDRIRGY